MTAPDLFEIALTHSSYTHERGGENNERLEFLGDAVLQLCVSELLHHEHPDNREGALSKLRASLVNESTLATVAREMKLVLRVGAGKDQAKLGDQDGPLSDAFEAWLAAVYLTEGLEAARRLVRERVLPHRGDPKPVVDPKSELQMWSQQHRVGEVPQYELVDQEGPDHQPTFTVHVTVGGELLGRGMGRSKKVAEQAAALDALRGLGLRT